MTKSKREPRRAGAVKSKPEAAPLGRPSTFTEAAADEICLWVTEGKSLSGYCRRVGAPDYSTVMRWLQAHENFRDNYTRAREWNGDHDADEIADVRSMALVGRITPDVARVAIDSLKWSAARRAPKKYGSQTAITGPGGRGLFEDLDLSRMSDAEFAQLKTLLAAGGAAIQDIAGGSASGDDPEDEQA